MNFKNIWRWFDGLETEYKLLFSIVAYSVLTLVILVSLDAYVKDKKYNKLKSFCTANSGHIGKHKGITSCYKAKQGSNSTLLEKFNSTGRITMDDM